MKPKCYDYLIDVYGHFMFFFMLWFPVSMIFLIENANVCPQLHCLPFTTEPSEII